MDLIYIYYTFMYDIRIETMNFTYWFYTVQQHFLHFNLYAVKCEITFHTAKEHEMKSNIALFHSLKVKRQSNTAHTKQSFI